MGQNEHIHIKNLDTVFQRLKSYGFLVNKIKCELFQDRIEYCGHEIDVQGLHKTASKVKAVLNCKQPTNVTELRSFLGLINYYHHFLPNLASTLHPLYKLMRSDTTFKWSEQCQKAFEKVKLDLVSENVLVRPSFGKCPSSL